jgi:hypothetical protein
MLIPRNVEILGSPCFSDCKSLSSITFESSSHLTRIESEAFWNSSLRSILIPRNVEILGSDCFYNCKSPSSIAFESNSELTRIESKAFYKSSLEFVLIPPTILFVASNAVDRISQIIFVDGNCCPELDRWLNLKRLNIAIDFRRIHCVGFDIPYLRDYIVSVSVFEESSIICDTDEVRNDICIRNEDEFSVLMKSIPLSERIEKSGIEQELEKLINLRCSDWFCDSC